MIHVIAVGQIVLLWAVFFWSRRRQMPVPQWVLHESLFGGSRSFRLSFAPAVAVACTVAYGAALIVEAAPDSARFVVVPAWVIGVLAVIYFVIGPGLYLPGVVPTWMIAVHVAQGQQSVPSHARRRLAQDPSAHRWLQGWPLLERSGRG